MKVLRSVHKTGCVTETLSPWQSHTGSQVKANPWQGHPLSQVNGQGHKMINVDVIGTCLTQRKAN